MAYDFTGKRALVTGAAQGIGLAVVRKLVSCGARVVALDVKADELKKLSEEIPGLETVVVDLSDWKRTAAALKSIGRVQLAVNNAGVNLPENIQVMTEEHSRTTLDINLNAVMVVCQHVINELSSDKTGGAIVNVASVLATRALVTKPVYVASKAAVVQFTRCIAVEAAPLGIRINCVSPGLVRTPMSEEERSIPEIMTSYARMVPMKNPIVEPEDIANAVAFLLSDEVAGKITGVNLPVDSGYLLT